MKRFLLDTNHLGEAIGRVSVVRIWPIDVAVADRYADVYHELRKKGRALFYPTLATVRLGPTITPQQPHRPPAPAPESTARR